MKRVKKEPKDKPAKVAAAPPPVVIEATPNEKRKSSQEDRKDNERASTESNKKVKVFIGSIMINHLVNIF